MEQEIKEKMKAIRAKWEGVPDNPSDTLSHNRRVIDRMIYRTLERKLAKMGVHGATVVPPKEDLVDIANRVFEIE